MSTPAQKRLLKDFQKIQKQEGQGINASPDEQNILKWDAMIQGIQGTSWQGGFFLLQLKFSQQYPNEAPNVKFISQMFHPNIYSDGRICLDMLQNQWSAAYDVWAILTSIRTLLSDPNILSPANHEAAKIFSENKNEYERRVKQIVQKSNVQQ